MKEETKSKISLAYRNFGKNNQICLVKSFNWRNL